MTKQGKPKRSWRRYASLSVRGLIILIVVIAAALAWFSIPAGVQRNAVRRHRKVWRQGSGMTSGGGHTDPAASGLVHSRTEDQTWTERLAVSASSLARMAGGFAAGLAAEMAGRTRLGPDYFGNVLSVSFTHRATDADLIHLGNLKRLERLDLYGSSVTDRGLANLERTCRIFKPSFWFAPRLATRGWRNWPV